MRCADREEQQQQLAGREARDRKHPMDEDGEAGQRSTKRETSEKKSVDGKCSDSA